MTVWLTDWLLYLLPSLWTPNLQMWLSTSMSTPWAWAPAWPSRSTERRRRRRRGEPAENNMLCPAGRVSPDWAITGLSQCPSVPPRVWRSERELKDGVGVGLFRCSSSSQCWSVLALTWEWATILTLVTILQIKKDLPARSSQRQLAGRSSG